MSDHGSVYIEWRDDVPVVWRADPVIGIAASLLADGRTQRDTGATFLWTDPTGALVFCGMAAYFPVRFDLDGRIVVCRLAWSRLRPAPEGGFTCPKCLRVSYHPTDATEGYCGACREWTRDRADG